MKNHVARKHEEKEDGLPGYTVQKPQKNEEDEKCLCDVCDFQCTSKIGLASHKKAMHEYLVYNCDKCAYSSRETGNVQRHREIEHGELSGQLQFCSECSFYCETETLLKTHQEENHKAADEDTKAEVYFYCDQCTYKSTHKYIINFHIRNTHDKDARKRLFCDQCDFTTMWKKSLKPHTKEKHEGF